MGSARSWNHYSRVRVPRRRFHKGREAGVRNAVSKRFEQTFVSCRVLWVTCMYVPRRLPDWLSRRSLCSESTHASAASASCRAVLRSMPALGDCVCSVVVRQVTVWGLAAGGTLRPCVQDARHYGQGCAQPGAARCHSALPGGAPMGVGGCVQY